ncbi:sarcosine oxidase subunit alpha family protein [Hwanghaeella sp.]|uniref:sarcosine oxidase subunit alpha family protein n=1 Tax=Hwanghaeella sp. TaxID=2605943 RepID=UPI003CCBA2A9
MAQKNRLSDGGRIDRTKPVRFTFNGKRYDGFAGDTLASALLANGVSLVGRSFKYHRPRGIMTAGSEEPNALVQLGKGARTEPNIRATQAELFDGLTAESQNCWPSVGFDIGAINSVMSKYLPAGFYYKTFMWPASMWMTYEHFIRNAAGLGKGPTEPDPDRYAQHHTACDVLIVGGGPAGLTAALAAGRSGARTILIDEQNEFGGWLLTDDTEIDGMAPADWVAGTVKELAGLENVTLLPRTTVSAYFDHNFLTAAQRVTDHLGPQADNRVPRQRFWKIRARQVVLAQGALERPIVFADNDRPGVMLASALRTYINRFGVLPGREIVVFTNNDSAYRTALDARKAGAVVHLVDLRSDPDSPIVHQARQAGIQVHEGSAVVGIKGAKSIHGVEIAPLSEDGKSLAGPAFVVSASVIAMSSGWNPSVHLFSQSRGKLRFDDTLTSFVPDRTPQKARSAGACNGTLTLAGCLAEGLQAGAAAAADAGFGNAVAGPAHVVKEDAIGTMRQIWTVPTVHPLGKGKRKHFLDHQNDVTAADVHLAAREGYLSVEHLKRYTTTGMGTDQGKTSNVNALAIMSELRAAAIPEVGTTTFRPPYTPTTFGAMGGQGVKELFEQQRGTAMHAWHQRNGAVFEDVGDWKRARYYPKPGEDMDEAVCRECRQARETVGIMDASTLGKIDIQGPDAAKLLNMVYTNAWDTLKPGRARYGLMLNEHGMVFDDGVTTCLGENHYHMTTTTGGAARVLNWLEEWLQTEWPEMQVYCTSVTEQWAVATLSGPKAREVLEAVAPKMNLDPQTFPFMAMQEGAVAGLPARVFRISFTGDLSYEINVPARYGMALWEALMEAGRPHDIVPYGTETMHVLRAEKGFIIVGQDTDGTVTPSDLDMNWIVSKKKDDFLGKRSLTRSDTARPGRKQLVGLLTEDPNFVLPEGAHLVKQVKPKPPMDMIGHVTSSYYSPNVGRSIAMALVKDGLNLKGQSFQVPLMSGHVETVTITDTVFFDKEGERARG